jgi:hypothetical protein
MNKFLEFFRSCGTGGQMRLDHTLAGLSLAIVGSLTIAVYSAFAFYTGYGIEVESIIESLLPGYTLTLSGAIVGVIWMFSLGFVFGSVTAWVYNKLIK